MQRTLFRPVVLVCCAVMSFSLAGCGDASDTQAVAAIEQMDENLQDAINSLQGAIGNLQVESSTSTAPITKWEYEFSSVVYDAKCATSAVAEHIDYDAVAKLLELGGTGRQLMALVGSSLDFTDGPDGVVLQDTVNTYLQCGNDEFAAHLVQMGDDGWEMVSYEQVSTDANDSLPAVPYAYEVMWKRPKQ